VAEHSLHTSSRTCFFIPEQALHFMLWRHHDSACDALPVLQWHPDHWNDNYLHSGASCTAVPCTAECKETWHISIFSVDICIALFCSV
jgi:hypothetical protein